MKNKKIGAKIFISFGIVIAMFAFDACPKVKFYVKSDLTEVIKFAQTYHIELSVSGK